MLLCKMCRNWVPLPIFFSRGAAAQRSWVHLSRLKHCFTFQKEWLKVYHTHIVTGNGALIMSPVSEVSFYQGLRCLLLLFLWYSVLHIWPPDQPTVCKKLPALKCFLTSLLRNVVTWGFSGIFVWWCLVLFFFFKRTPCISSSSVVKYFFTLDFITRDFAENVTLTCN